MMSNLNTPVRLSGFIAGDPQVRVTGDNRKVLRVRLAVNEKKKFASGNRAVVTHWHQLVFWGSQAQIAERQLRKGKAVSVTGRLVRRCYTDERGADRQVAEVLVYTMVAQDAGQFRLFD